MSRSWLRLIAIAIILLLIIAIGTIGFYLIESIPLLDALFMTIITVSTVGYREVVPLSSAGKVFAMLLILVGVGTVAYLAGTFINITIQGFLQPRFIERRLERIMRKFQNHFIIAGFGRVGKNVAKEFEKSKEAFVVIENNPERTLELEKAGYTTIKGDATEDEALIKAGINKAKGLVAAIGSDADNVFIVLTARNIKEDLYIVARANTVEAVDKLKSAGANHVVSPPVIGGRRMAAWLLRPVVSDYLDLVGHGALGHGAQLGYRLEEIKLGSSSSLASKSISESDIRGKTGVMILAIKSGEDINTNPDINTVLKPDDLLIVIGTDDQLKAVEEMA